jgi:hypothetical protein
MATLAAHPEEAILEAAALEVVLEPLLYLPRQVLALGRQMRLERRTELLDRLIKEGALRAVAHTRWRARAGFPAIRQRQHDRILAKSSCG